MYSLCWLVFKPQRVGAPATLKVSTVQTPAGTAAAAPTVVVVSGGDKTNPPYTIDFNDRNRLKIKGIQMMICS